MRRFVMFALLTVMVTGCVRDLHLKDKEVVVTNRMYSPDSGYVVFTYYIDNGAMGESRSMASVLKVTDTLGSLNKGRLPCRDLPYNSCYFPSRWISSKTLEVNLQEISFVKAGLPFDSSAIKVNGIDCKVVPNEDSHRLTQLIKSVRFSDDRKKMLVVYESTGDNYSDVNISAIKYGDTLPTYGNLVTIPESNVDPIRYAAWHGDAIDMYMKDARMYDPVDFVNKGAAYTVEFVEIDESKAPVDTVLYDDPRIDLLLKENGVTTYGVITKCLWGETNGKSVFNCAYSYRVAGRRFRTAFKIIRELKAGAPYKIGDSVEVVYDPKAPFIHSDKVSR